MIDSSFVPYGPYLDIINAVGMWKIIDLNSLLGQCNYQFNYSNLRKKVKLLEKCGILKSVSLGRKKKHIYLTNMGIRFTQYDKTYELTSECMNHDVIVGTVLRSLLMHPAFFNGKMFHQVDENEIEPDAILSGIKSGKEYHLAIEVELTQKSSTRVKSKYSKYSRSRIFDYCLYISNKEGLLRAYKKFIAVMSKDVQSKIIFMHVPDLSPNKFNYIDANCFFKNEKKSFEDIFGD